MNTIDERLSVHGTLRCDDRTTYTGSGYIMGYFSPNHKPEVVLMITTESSVERIKEKTLKIIKGRLLEIIEEIETYR